MLAFIYLKLNHVLNSRNAHGYIDKLDATSVIFRSIVVAVF